MQVSLASLVVWEREGSLLAAAQSGGVSVEKLIFPEMYAKHCTSHHTLHRSIHLQH